MFGQTLSSLTLTKLYLFDPAQFDSWLRQLLHLILFEEVVEKKG
jgi:hypothetical protein